MSWSVEGLWAGRVLDVSAPQRSKAADTAVSLILFSCVCPASRKKHSIRSTEINYAIPWETSTEILRISIGDSLLIDIIASDVPEFNCRFFGNYWWEIAVRCALKYHLYSIGLLENNHLYLDVKISLIIKHLLSLLLKSSIFNYNYWHSVVLLIKHLHCNIWPKESLH